MTTNFAYSKSGNAWIYVLPERVYTPELSMFCTHLLGELETRRNRMEDPYTFRGIREYAYGDTIGKVNWKATAKTAQLMVNMYGYTSEQRVRILLNLETNMMGKTESLQEMSIRMAGTVAEYFLKNILFCRFSFSLLGGFYYSNRLSLNYILYSVNNNSVSCANTF